MHTLKYVFIYIYMLRRGFIGPLKGLIRGFNQCEHWVACKFFFKFCPFGANHPALICLYACMFIQEFQVQQRYHIQQGDVLAVLKTLPADYFDACLSDPPYGISFMGKEWDKGVPSAEVYTELLRVLKPGAMGLHFGGTRMWHRLATNLEDAGFELRDTVMWLYGSGFPKSHNISKALDKAAGAEREVIGAVVRGPRDGSTTSGIEGGAGYRFGTCSPITTPTTPAAKQWEGWGTALKPAWEPALLVQKPLAGTFANNALTHGCGALNVEGCRVGLAEGEVLTGGFGNAGIGLSQGVAESDNGRGVEWQSSTVGRFPANLILDEEAGEALDATQPVSKSKRSTGPRSGKPNGVLGAFQGQEDAIKTYDGEGGPSRFFYCAKVSTKERNAGLAAFADKEWAADGACVPALERRPFNPSKNNHPTLKPIALTEYLARLLLVPARTDGQPRRLLVPFSGAGSEMIGALKAGWDEVWGIEMDGDYVRIACARIEHHTGAVQLEAVSEEAVAA